MADTPSDAAPTAGARPAPHASLARVRRTKIVATLGPATNTAEQIASLLRAGVDVVRLNFSHGEPAEHAAVFRLVREQSAALDRPVAIMQDLQGPKIRIGRLAGGGPLQLADGQELVLSAEPGLLGQDGVVSVTYPALATDVRAGDRILLDDGLLELRVVASEPPRVRTVVVHGGPLGEHKGINLPGVAVSAPALTEKDRADLVFGLALGVDYVALSFVRRPEDVAQARAAMRAAPSAAGPAREVPLIVKLEKPEAIAELDAILRAADGVMVARGDLAVEMSPEEVPPIQKRIILKANAAGKPVITATQMLQSMTDNPRPTRAEASDVANAVLDGSDAVMLSGETAVGRYPSETVAAMARIAVAAEAMMPDQLPPMLSGRGLARTRAHAVVRAACLLAQEVGARALVVFTRTGQTAELVSHCRPRVPIYAFTPHEAVCRRLALHWGVAPICTPLGGDTDSMLQRVSAELVTRGLLALGDSVVMVGAAHRLGSHRADLIKLHTI